MKDAHPEPATTVKSKLRNTKHRPGFSWAMIGFLATILILALFLLYILLQESRQLIKPQTRKQPLFALIIDGRPLVLSKEGADALQTQLLDALPEQKESLKAQLAQHIHQQVRYAFEPVHERVGQFADWYYSLTGEYGRYLNTLQGQIQEHLHARAQALLFTPAHLEQRIDQILPQINRYTENLFASAVQDLLAQAQKQVTRRQAIEITATHAQSTNLDQRLQQALVLSSSDLQRQVVASLAALGTSIAIVKGLGAVMAKKALAKIAGTKTFELAGSLLVKLAAKSALKGGSSLGGAGVGAALCAPTGPGALICGAIGGLVAWIAVDKLVIELDEQLNREAFEADIHQALHAQEKELEQILLAAYLQIVEQNFQRLSQDLELQPIHSYVPAKEIGQ